MNKEIEAMNAAGFSPLALACRQLELCGFCPKQKKDNGLDEIFYRCSRAKAGGVSACHNCIREFIEADYENRPHPKNKVSG